MVVSNTMAGVVLEPLAVFQGGKRVAVVLFFNQPGKVCFSHQDIAVQRSVQPGLIMPPTHPTPGNTTETASTFVSGAPQGCACRGRSPTRGGRQLAGASLQRCYHQRLP